MRPAYGLLVAALAGLCIWLAVLWAMSTQPPPNPLRDHAPCIELAAGPSPLYACSDGHGYVHQDGRWIDAGNLTPDLAAEGMTDPLVWAQIAALWQAVIDLEKGKDYGEEVDPCA